MPACIRCSRRWRRSGRITTGMRPIYSGAARARVRASALLDIVVSDSGYALCDLAIAIERNIIGWRAQPYVHSGSIDWDALHAFLDGYESLKPLTEAEA